MRREVELRRRLDALNALGEAVGAMKSLSAQHFRRVRRAVEPARTYREGVGRILGGVGVQMRGGGGGAGVLVIGAELGLCGNYNGQLSVAGARRRAELGPGPTFCVGRRAATLLGRRGVDIVKVYPGPTGVRGVTELLMTLAEDVLECYAHERLSSFEIVSSRFGGVGKAAPRGVRLLPVESDPVDDRPPSRYVGAEHFRRMVVREFLYSTLYGLLLDALAGEHGARLAATEAAERWLEGRTTQLGRRLSATRREAGTQEVIEIAAGARAKRDNPWAAT